MGQTVLTLKPRLFAHPTRRNQIRTMQVVAPSPTSALQHPALSYATEEASIHNSLDQSFRQDVAVSRLDRQLIDDLNRVEPLCAELLASGF
jgi:hypothetical protein